MKRRRFRPRGKSLRTKTNQLSVRRLPLPPRVCGPSNLRDDHEILGSHAFSTRRGVRRDRPRALSARRRRLGFAAGPVARASPPARVRFGARAGPSVRAGGSRAFESAPVSNAGSASSEGAIRRTDRSRRDRGSGGSVARARVPLFSPRCAASARCRPRRPRAKRAADSSRSPAERRPRASSTSTPVHAEPAGPPNDSRAPSRAALVTSAAPSRSAGPGSELALVSWLRREAAGWRPSSRRRASPSRRTAPPRDGRRARAMRLARLPLLDDHPAAAIPATLKAEHADAVAAKSDAVERLAEANRRARDLRRALRVARPKRSPSPAAADPPRDCSLRRSRRRSSPRSAPPSPSRASCARTPRRRRTPR